MEKELLHGLMELKKQEHGKMESCKNNVERKLFRSKIKDLPETLKQMMGFSN